MYRHRFGYDDRTDRARSTVRITCPVRIDVAYHQGAADERNGSTTDSFDLPDATEEMTSMPQDAMPTDSVATSVPGDPSDAAELAAAAADDLAGATEAATATRGDLAARLTAAKPEQGTAGSDAIALLDLFDEATAELGNVGALAGLVAKCHPDGAMRDAADTAEQEIAKVLT